MNVLRKTAEELYRAAETYRCRVEDLGYSTTARGHFEILANALDRLALDTEAVARDLEPIEPSNGKVEPF